MTRFRAHKVIALAASMAAAGCAGPLPGPPRHPSVMPATQPSVSLELSASQIRPMYRELLAIDLPTVARVANARSLDIQRARQQVEANRGRYESNVEAIFPVIAPSIAYSHFQGVGQNANGTLTSPVHFDNLIPGISIQWILNPGTVVYDIIASKRRMEASAKQEESIVLDTTRIAAVQFYDLTLAQAQLQVAQQAVSEAQELLRITQLQVKAGTGLPADEVRAEAQLAAFQQDVFVALDRFYQASVALTLTLHLDPVVTLVPATGRAQQTTLVRDDLSIDELIASAVKYRPDLTAARDLLLASQADTGATVWGGIGPQLQAAYSADAIRTNVGGRQLDWKDQQKAGIGAGMALGLSTFGNLKTAQANERSAGIDAQRQLDLVRAAVVAAQQNSSTNAKLIPVARRQLDSAQEALRLTQANLQAGTALVIDVLQAQNAVDDARLRFVTAVIHYNQSQVNLLAAVGLIDQMALVPARPIPPPATEPSGPVRSREVPASQVALQP